MILLSVGRPSWHPNGQHIIYEQLVDGVTEVWRMDIENRKAIRIIEGDST